MGSASPDPGARRRLVAYSRLAVLALVVPACASAIAVAVAVDRGLGRPPLRGWGRRMQAASCALLLRCCAVRVEYDARDLPAGPLLLACNHVSWLDILVLARVWPVRFLSKQDVARWPLVGRAATSLGTLYLDRGRREASEQALVAMRESLRSGDNVVFFPEATTTAGDRILPFRARLFQAALDAEAAVQPLAIRYLDRQRQPTRAPAFCDNEPFASHVRRLLHEPEVIVSLRVLERIPVEAMDRSALARSAQAAIATELQLPVRRADGSRRSGAADADIKLSRH